MPQERFGSLSGKRIGILGYGSQGRAQALNLRDSGFSPLIGSRPGKSCNIASRDGFHVTSLEDTVSQSDIVMVLLPDDVHGEVCKDVVFPNLKVDARIGFAAGFSVHFGMVKPPEPRHVFLVAPKGPGEILRKRYLEGSGIPALIAALENDEASMEIARDYACAIGCDRAAIIETSFEEEATADLFGEQCVLVGGMIELMKAAFKVLTERGYPPEIAYIECIAEVEYMASLINRLGMEDLAKHISSTAYFGGTTRGKVLINEGVVTKMRKILEEIESGTFFEEFAAYLRTGKKLDVDNEELGEIERAKKRLFKRQRS